MRQTLLVMTVLAVLVGACGGDATLRVADAWARSALGPNGAVYLTIDGGETDVALTGASASSDVAAAVEIHQTVTRNDGTMGMTQMPQVEIPAESTVMMVPGGLHVMLMDLSQPLELGTTFDMTLTFNNGAVLTTIVEVRDE